jgi:hypothetical protein
MGSCSGNFWPNLVITLGEWKKWVHVYFFLVSRGRNQSKCNNKNLDMDHVLRLVRFRIYLELFLVYSGCLNSRTDVCYGLISSPHKSESNPVPWWMFTAQCTPRASTMQIHKHQPPSTIQYLRITTRGKHLNSNTNRDYRFNSTRGS